MIVKYHAADCRRRIKQNIIKMNKKFFLSVMPAVALAMCAFTFTSCDDDDDEYRMPTGPAATYAGKLVTGVGSYKFHYDDNNRCYKVTSSYGDVVMIDYKRGTISLESEDEEFRVSFNGKGYITNMSGSWSDRDGEVTVKGSGSISYLYDGEGRLVSHKESASESGTYNGYRYSYNESASMSCKWVDGDLVSVLIRCDENEDGDKSWYTDEYTITYDKMNENAERQFPVVFGDFFGDDYYTLAMVGMFGKGPAHLPETVIDEYEENGGSTYTDRYNVSFGLNYDGTIDWERINGSAYTYSYMTYLSDGEDDVMVDVPYKVAPAGKKRMSVRGFFMRHRDRK